MEEGMTAEEIRSIGFLDGADMGSYARVSAAMLREIAAQLAELNAKLDGVVTPSGNHIRAASA